MGGFRRGLVGRVRGILKLAKFSESFGMDQLAKANRLVVGCPSDWLGFNWKVLSAENPDSDRTHPYGCTWVLLQMPRQACIGSHDGLSVYLPPYILFACNCRPHASRCMEYIIEHIVKLEFLIKAEYTSSSKLPARLMNQF